MAAEPFSAIGQSLLRVAASTLAYPRHEWLASPSPATMSSPNCRTRRSPTRSNSACRSHFIAAKPQSTSRIIKTRNFQEGQGNTSVGSFNGPQVEPGPCRRANIMDHSFSPLYLYARAMLPDLTTPSAPLTLNVKLLLLVSCNMTSPLFAGVAFDGGVKTIFFE